MSQKILPQIYQELGEDFFTRLRDKGGKFRNDNVGSLRAEFNGKILKLLSIPAVINYYQAEILNVIAKDVERFCKPWGVKSPRRTADQIAKDKVAKAVGNLIRGVMHGEVIVTRTLKNTLHQLQISVDAKAHMKMAEAIAFGLVKFKGRQVTSEEELMTILLERAREDQEEQESQEDSQEVAA